MVKRSRRLGLGAFQAGAKVGGASAVGDIVPAGRRRKGEAVKEVSFNERFADALRMSAGWDDSWIVKDSADVGLFAEERRSPDVLLILPNSPPIVVECKFDDGSGDPVEDAKKELGLTISQAEAGASGQKIHRAAAVYYPPGARQWGDREVVTRFVDGGEQVRWKFLSGRGADDCTLWPEQGWLTGSVFDFADSIAKTAAAAETIDRAAGGAAGYILAAAASLDAVLFNHPAEKERISALMGSPDDIRIGLQVACLVWFDSMLILNELGRRNPQFGSTAACRDAVGKIFAQKIKEEWGKVLVVNYDSVFRPAFDAFPQVLPPASYREIFTTLANAVDEVEQYLLGETASLAGGIFARVMDDGQRKNSAAFYTRPEVAEYLTHLTLPDVAELSDDWRSWRIADFACGTGTLLRAGYRRLQQFASACRAPLDDYHRTMIEAGLCGVDVAPIAVHLTAAGIVSLRPEVDYNPTNIGLARIGATDGGNGGVFTGSVELLGEHETRLFTDNYDTQRGTEIENGQGISVLAAEDGSFDAVLMNPPYSRTRGGQKLFDLSGISCSDRLAAQKRVWRLAEGTCGDGKAGLASVFAAIGDRKLQDGKRMGLVLPLTCAAAGSWGKFRSMMAEGYSDLTVTSFARGVEGGRHSLSEDTSMGEVLVTARKSKFGREGTAYVSLDGLFSSDVEASEAARSVHRALSGAKPGDAGVLKVGGDRAGSWYVGLTSRVWGGAGAAGLLGLVPAAELLVEGTIRSVDDRVTARFPAAKLSDLFDVGPTHHSIGHNVGNQPIGAFTFHPIDPEKLYRNSPYTALWATEAESQTAVLTEPTHYGVKYADDEKVREQLDRKTDLFHKKNMRWTSNTALAVVSENKMLGGSEWAGIRPRPDDDRIGSNWESVRYAAAVWANSIFGFVSFWMQGQRQQQGRSRAQIHDICQLTIPDFRDQALLERARLVQAEHGNALFELELKPANQAHSDPNRRKLDLAAAAILGIDARKAEQTARYLAGQWTAEPSVASSRSR